MKELFDKILADIKHVAKRYETHAASLLHDHETLRQQLKDRDWEIQRLSTDIIRLEKQLATCREGISKDTDEIIELNLKLSEE